MRTLPSFLLLAASLTTAGCGPSALDDAGEASRDGDEDDDDAYEPYAAGKTDGDTLGGAIRFAHECSPGTEITIAAVGDVLLHTPLQRQAIREEDRFRSLWRGIEDLLESADLTYANLEGPTATGVNRGGRDVTDPGFVFDDYVYSSYPQFNYHRFLLEDLIASGVDVVSTANNHSLDRMALGADRTIEALREVGLPYTGTRVRDEDGPWWTVTEAQGIRVAWLACTYGTNGIPDSHGQVLGCWSDADAIEHFIRLLNEDTTVDAVVVTPHWGTEYTAVPTKAQRDLARRFAEAGAVAVLGSHPHVLQPWEKVVTSDGREVFVHYSLGNFVSGQSRLARRSTILLYLALKRLDDGSVHVAGVSYLPLHMTRTGDTTRELQAIDRVGGLGDSRSLTLALLGSENLAEPVAPVDATRCE